MVGLSEGNKDQNGNFSSMAALPAEDACRDNV
jgi:hypothetical protein